MSKAILTLLRKPGLIPAIGLVLVLLAVSVGRSHAQTTIYSTSWEPGTLSAGSWRTLVRDWDCPCPAASFNFSSASAARTGTVGVQATISVPSNEGWHVQLQSPVFNLSSTQLHTACFWVRSAESNANVPMNLIELSGYKWIAGGSVQATTDWRQVCVRDFQPPAAVASSAYYYVLDLGRTAATVQIDDFTLTARPAADDLLYVNSTNVDSRIQTYRKGRFQITFIKKSTNKVLGGSKLGSLKLRLAMHDFPFGTAMEWDGVPANRLNWYLSTVKKHYNALVPEWSFKWPSYEPVQGQYQERYNYLMRNHVNFSVANDFVLARGHTLEWPTSGWSFPSHWSRQHGCDNYRSYLYTRITREVTAFKGMFKSYDVFNEVVHERQFIQDCPGMWPGILHDAFRWAAAADPTAQLCLNDYGLITGDDWPSMVQLVTDMLAAGVPIHCIGVQAYVSTQNRPTPAYMKPRLDQLAALNLSILITEFNFLSYWDANGPVWSGTDAQHAALYDEYVRFWFSVPYIKGILMWGFWDSMNWIRNGGIYYANTTAKASATKLLSLWGTTWNTTITSTNVVLPTNGTYGPYSGFYGKYYYDVTVGGVRYTGFVRFPAQGGSAQTATVYLG